MVNDLWHGRRYYSLGSYIKNTYGQRLYKLPLSSGATCPNRDGSKGYGGCIFCSEKGSGDYAGDAALSVADQIMQAKDTIGTRFSDGGYIAYFQSFTATYAPMDHLRKIFTEAIEHPEVKVLSIATRPDCLDEERYELIRDLAKQKPVWVELGLQTTKEESVALINRCYETKDYDKAMERLNSMGIETITHVILGLPGESTEDMLSTVKHAVDAGTRGIKLQLLHVLKGTVLARMYEKGDFNVLTEEEYVTIVGKCLEIIPKDRVIHRLTGDGPKEILIAPEWSTHKRSVLNHIHHYLKSHDTFQGKALIKKE
ncbi:MAG: TIGR01212 family radical SAM protein [Lachnospiraceae bacterium]|nr:TIGR01212 family radical SAM protein [Lachnospiraceae bacterium]